MLSPHGVPNLDWCQRVSHCRSQHSVCSTSLSSINLNLWDGLRNVDGCISLQLGYKFLGAAFGRG